MLRQEIAREIDMAKAQIEAVLATLNASPNRDQMLDQIHALQGELSQLDGLLLQASTGNATQLAALQVGVSLSVGSVQVTTSQIASSATASSYQSVMLMNHDQLVALERNYMEQSDRFQQFETHALDRIDQLAAANGVDVSAFHENQQKLQAEYEQARARGDLAGMLEADALRATNVRIGLEEVGAPAAEIEAAREQEQATERAYLEQTAIEARREAEQQGMSGEAISSHVAGAVAEADAGLDEGRTEIAGELDAIALDMIPLNVEAGTYEVAEVTEAAAPLTTPTDQQTSVEMQI